MALDSSFYVRFWGVRGSIASPGPETAIYGGNTPCVEIYCGSQLLIFDAGTGLRSLGKLIDKNGVNDVDLFLSHTHAEHIVGLPFFSYAYKPGNTLRIWSGHLESDKTTESVLRQSMANPLFPVSVDIFSADVSYHDFKAGETLLSLIHI